MADTLSLRERIAQIKHRWLSVCESIAQATPREWGALDQSYYQAGLAIIDAEVQPMVEQAIQQARDESEAEIATLQRALEAWAARERAADRVREAISKKGHGDA